MRHAAPARARRGPGNEPARKDDRNEQGTRTPAERHACEFVRFERADRTRKGGFVKDARTRSAAFATALFWTCGTLAQSLSDAPARDEEPRDLSAVDDAVEITIATGYAQAFGATSSGQPNLTELGLAGWSLQLGVGYRLTPRLALAGYGGGALSQQAHLDGESLYSALAGFRADWHFLPAGYEFDPWASLGAGWRGYWIEQAEGATSLQGFDLLKLQAGLDYRAERRAALGPVLGLDLSRFVWQAGPGAKSYEGTSHPRVNVFVFVGVMGRLDIPRDKRERARVASL
jgi:hypothetical protein